jgi:NADPH:quinone reductase-like Zn-dependent oxidoreductase
VRAVVLPAHGGPDALRVREYPEPALGDREVLIELRAAALNRRDALIRAGAGPAYRMPLPLVLGSDGAGIRRDTEEELIILPSLSWGPREDLAAADFRILGGPDDGTYAELVAVPAENVYAKPVGLSWLEAAALPLAALTAYRALFPVAGLQSGERLVVLGAGSGMSLAAIQLAVDRGARVAVTSSSRQKLDRALELGAEVAVNYRDEDWVAQLKRAWDVDVVLDSVGGTWAQSLELLAPGGRLVACGGTRGDVATLDVRALYLQQKRILGTKMGSPSDFEQLLALVERGALKPVVDSVFALGEAGKAHAHLEAGKHFGKIVLDTAT